MSSWVGLIFSLLITVPVWAGVPANVPPVEDPLLQKFLKSMAEHLNTVECLTATPNGSVLGTHGELKCYASGGEHYLCMNTSTGPSKGTSWTCLNVAARPTTGVFCGGTASVSHTCEGFRGRIPVACTLNRVDATVTTAPTGTSILIDINECTAPTTCTTVWSTQSNRLTIAANALSGSQTTFNDTSVAVGNYIGFDLDQVGSSTAGQNLTVTVVCQ